MQIEPPFEENEEESKESKFWNDLYENEYNTINPVVCIGSRISDTDNYIFVNHNARDMLQGFSDMLTEDDEKEDIVVFVPKGRNAESYKDIAKEEIDSLTQNAEELRVVYKEYSGREQFYYLNSNREEAIDGLSRATNPIVIYQANEAVALNGSYIETGTYNGEVIYGCDESTIRIAGSGKSTLLNMIGGIEKPDSGSIIIEGLNITRLKNKNSFFADTVGFLFSEFCTA